MGDLLIARDLALPLSAVTQRLAFLGISGSGKTYAAGKFAELLIDAGAQVVVIDTVGNWYGLRLAGDGKHPGITIPIFGGEHGDVPLREGDGERMADLLVDSRTPAIVDVSDFTQGGLRRFVAAFATELFEKKKRQKSPLMLLWEECQDVMPQESFTADSVMLGAVQRLVKKGRNYGIGNTMISQQPQAVNKKCLNQASTLFLFRTGGAHERKAIKEWVNTKHVEESVLDDMNALETGVAIVASPEWLQVLKRVKVAAKRTFDSTKTPEIGDVEPAKTLAPVDLTKIRETWSAVIAEAEADDPKVLRKRVADLERQLAARQQQVAPEKRVEVPVLPAQDLARLERAAELLDERSTHLVQGLQVVVSELGAVKSALARMRAPAPAKALAPTAARRSPAPPAARPRDVATAPGVTRPQKNILDALAWFEAIGIPSPSRVAAAFIAGASSKSSAYINNLGALRSAGLIAYPHDGHVALTGHGRASAHPPDIAPTAEALQQAALAAVTEPQSRILAALIEAYPAALSRQELAERAKASPLSSSYINNLGALRTLGVIDYPAQGRVAATALLFPGAR